VRCFVAVDLPDDVRAALAEAQARLRGAAPRADVRWTAAGAMHLTLEFLGEVSPETSQPVRAAVAAVAGGWAHLRLGCGGLGVFPGPSRPRVLWAGITGDLAGLGELAAGIERALEPLGFPPPRRPFRGHVTLGRVRSPRGLAPLLGALEGGRDATFGAWTAAEVVLYRSHLSPRGSRYEALARLPLGAAVA
jgi:2'-5' RNA ligase